MLTSHMSCRRAPQIVWAKILKIEIIVSYDSWGK